MDHFMRVPEEVLDKIFRKAVWTGENFDVRTLSRLERVSPTFRAASKKVTLLADRVVDDDVRKQFLNYITRNRRAWEGLRLMVCQPSDLLLLAQAAIAPAQQSFKHLEVDVKRAPEDNGLSWQLLLTMVESCPRLESLSMTTSEGPPFTPSPSTWRLSSTLQFLKLSAVFTRGSLCGLVDSLPVLKTLILEGFIGEVGEDGWDGVTYEVRSKSLTSLKLFEQKCVPTRLILSCPVLENLMFISHIAKDPTSSIQLECPALTWLHVYGTWKEVCGNLPRVETLIVTMHETNVSWTQKVCQNAKTLAFNSPYHMQNRMELFALPILAECRGLQKVVLISSATPSALACWYFADWVPGVVEVSLTGKASCKKAVSALLERSNVRVIKANRNDFAREPRVVHSTQEFKSEDRVPNVFVFPENL
jgi:hypothetical protein